MAQDKDPGITIDMIAEEHPSLQTSAAKRDPLVLADIALRGLLAAVMVWAGLSKIVDPAGFYGSILAYQLPLPPLFLKTAAVVLPWLEIFCGLLLAANIARRATLMLVIGLFALFLAMVVQAYLRGLNISCGCLDLSPFGIPQASKTGLLLESIGFAIFRNLGLLAAAFFLWKTTAPLQADRK